MTSRQPGRSSAGLCQFAVSFFYSTRYRKSLPRSLINGSDMRDSTLLVILEESATSRLALGVAADFVLPSLRRDRNRVDVMAT